MHYKAWCGPDKLKRYHKLILSGSIEKRGAGSPCGSLFSTVDDEFVPEIQAVYARAA